jgi:hypothetical protein
MMMPIEGWYMKKDKNGTENWGHKPLGAIIGQDALLPVHFNVEDTGLWPAAPLPAFVRDAESRRVTTMTAMLTRLQKKSFESKGVEADIRFHVLEGQPPPLFRIARNLWSASKPHAPLDTSNFNWLATAV